MLTDADRQNALTETMANAIYKGSRAYDQFMRYYWPRPPIVSGFRRRRRVVGSIWTQVMRISWDKGYPRQRKMMSRDNKTA